jgi:hypothetical protein
MPDVSQVVNIVQFFAPGFFLVQALYLLGVARKGSVFETAVWSVVLNVPVRWVGTQLVTLAGLNIAQGLTFELYLLAVALAPGLIIAAIRGIGSLFRKFVQEFIL